MQISFCTIAFQKNKWGPDRKLEATLEAIIPLLAQAGYDAVEIWVDHWLTADEAARQRILQLLKDSHLRVAMLSSYYNFTTSDELAKASLDHAEVILREARRLGSSGIRLFTGKTASRDATPEQWQRATSALQQLCDRSAGQPLQWCLETHSWNLMDSIEGTLKLLRLVERPNLKLIYQPSSFGLQYMEALDALGPHIAHVHATNHSGRAVASLAQGELDWARIVAGLKQRGFAGCLSVEWFGPQPEEAVQREAAYLRQLIAQS